MGGMCERCETTTTTTVPVTTATTTTMPEPTTTYYSEAAFHDISRNMHLRGNLRRPRWLQRLRAWAIGYFWLPCPVCGLSFGGHEMGDTMLPGGEGVCEACAPLVRAGWDPSQYVDPTLAEH
jgi:hypothetical protein